MKWIGLSHGTTGFVSIGLAAMLAPAGVLAGTAERPIEREFLVQQEIRNPVPSCGLVGVNPPNFMWYAGVEKPDGRHFLFELSRAIDFKHPDTLSVKIDWPVFNPHRPLEPGVWYWRYGTVIAGNTDWSEAIRFEITGDERDWCPPPAETLLKALPATHPRHLAKEEQVGSYLPRSEMVDDYVKKGAGLLNEPLPKTLIYNDQEVLKEKRSALNDVNYTRFISKKTKEKFLPEADKVYTLLRCYILTGNPVFAKAAVKRLAYFEEQHRKINAAGYYNDFTTGNLHLLQAVVFDTCYGQLSRKERTHLSEEIAALLEKELNQMVFRSVHAATGSHFWQHHMRNFFTTAVIMKGHDPIADDCIRFVYALWNARAPVGSRNDGGWAPGNGYFGANTETLALMPLWLTEYTGFDFFAHPWWKRVGEYLMYTSPVGHIAGGFGDHAEVYTESMTRLVKSLAYTSQEPHVVWYARNTSKPRDISLQLRKNLDWFVAPYAEGIDLAELPAAEPGFFAVFPEVGNAAFHSDMTAPESNATLMFRSSPLGALGHGHPGQNAFNICHGGRPLFFHTGYYSSWADFHSLQSYKHTRAHNTVLADGIGQRLSTAGYGWLPRQLDGERIRYVMGDASRAYSGDPMMREEFLEQFARWEIPVTRENGFGDPGITRFRRHIVALDASVYLIYDELEAKQPVTWNWLLHGWNRIDDDGRIYSTENETGRATVELLASVPLSRSVTDRFHAPADDWLGNGAKKGIEYVNQWHARTDTAEKAEVCRFLAVIQVTDKGADPIPLLREGEHYVLGDWKIEARLDPAKPARLTVVSADGTTGFSTGTDTALRISEKEFHPAVPGASLLVEEAGDSVSEAVDVWPDTARFY